MFLKHIGALHLFLTVFKARWRIFKNVFFSSPWGGVLAVLWRLQNVVYQEWRRQVLGWEFNLSFALCPSIYGSGSLCTVAKNCPKCNHNWIMCTGNKISSPKIKTFLWDLSFIPSTFWQYLCIHPNLKCNLWKVFVVFYHQQIVSEMFGKNHSKRKYFVWGRGSILFYLFTGVVQIS